MSRLITRAPKEAIDHRQFTAAWRERAHALGFTEHVRRAIVAQTKVSPGTGVERTQGIVIRAAPGVARGFVGFTTRDAIATEERMLGLERAGRVMLDRLAHHVDAATIVARDETASAKMGDSWTEGQRAATKALLVSTNSVTGVQGSASTAKTTAVLRNHAEAARARGHTVRALAPTATEELAPATPRRCSLRRTTSAPPSCWSAT